MPAYDYRCPSCGHVFEVVRTITDRSDEACPVCAATAKRVFTPVGIAFKGSGFYNTDSRSRPKSEESSPTGKDSCQSAANSACATCPAASTSSDD